MITCFVLNVFVMVGLRQTMDYANRKRDREQGTRAHQLEAEIVEGNVAELQIDETDWENKEMRYEL